MRFLVVATAFAVVACGGSEAPKTPTKPEPVKVEAPKPADAAPPAAPAGEAPAAAPAAGPLTAESLAAMDDAGKKTALLDLGKKVYETGGSGGLACVTCHQANGEGLPPSFPPLKGQGEFMGDCKKHAGYVIKGLQGEITVGGVKYNGVMPPQANLSDLEIAAVISYERMSWGNNFGICLPDAVAAARKGG